MSEFNKTELAEFIRDTDNRVARETHSPSSFFEAFCESVDRMRQHLNPDWPSGKTREELYPLTVWAKVEWLEKALEQAMDMVVIKRAKDDCWIEPIDVILDAKDVPELAQYLAERERMSER